MENSESKPVFTLSIAAEIIGVHPRTLMIYEKEGLVTPTRTRTNRRRFSKDAIRQLHFIRYLTNTKGVNLAGVRAVLDLIDSAEKKGINLRKIVFPDYSEKSII